MSIWTKTIGASFLGVSVLLLMGCSLSSSRVGPQGEPLHPTLTRSSYIERGKLLTVVVGTRPTRIRDEAKFMPLEIAVANNGMESLTVTRESFTLVNGDGSKRYSVVSAEELRDTDYNVDVDRRLGEVLPVMNDKYTNYERVASNLSPSFDAPSERSPVRLSRFSWLYDYIYFPWPEGGVEEQSFDLLFKTREMENPVVVRFAVE